MQTVTLQPDELGQVVVPQELRDRELVAIPADELPDLEVDPFPRHVVYEVSGEGERIPLELWQELKGPKPPQGWSCDGCTASPDYIRGRSIRPACILHDWHYNESCPFLSRRKADAYFRVNTRRCLRYWGAGWLERQGVALAYWRGVRRAGAPFFRTPIR